MNKKSQSIDLAIIDTDNYVLANFAVDYTLKQKDFKELLIFTDAPEKWPNKSTIKINKIKSTSEYNRLVLSVLPNYIKSEFVLIIQFDGFALNKECFSPIFLEYDYIGAPWHHYKTLTVGNGGFSLRSKRLAEVVSCIPYVDENVPEDIFVCHHLHAELSRLQLDIAPEKIAKHFSFERPVPPHPTFGFHGIFNLPAIFSNAPEFLVENLSDKLIRSKINDLYPPLSAISTSAASALAKRFNQICNLPT
jgi:hypothetical protein